MNMPPSLAKTNLNTIVAAAARDGSSIDMLDAEILSRVLGNINLPILVTQSDGRIVLWNRAMEVLTGKTGADFSEFNADHMSVAGQAAADQQLARKALETGQPQTRHSEWRTHDQTETPVELQYSVLTGSRGETLLLLQARNLSERHKLELELLQSQKMESIGRLAGGIAHDFNNALTTILGLTESMISGRTAPNAESLSEIRHAAQHAADLTSQMLAFSRRQILQMRNIHLESVVENLGRMVARLIGEDINLAVTAQAPLPAIRGDQSQIEQVLLNLCLNARDAMPKGGSLRVELRNVTLDPAWCSKRSGSRPGNFVALSVSDSGMGMDAETLTRIFEPFYTKKAVGKGTGLGLSMVYGIVEQHEGFIDVESAMGKGSTFTIYFPVASAESTPQAEVARTVAPPVQSRATLIPSIAAATILVVEDEKSVRKLFLELLPKLGHRIYSAADGDEAIKVFERWAGQIDLVLLDAIIPKTGSGEVYEYIRRKKPGVRFLFTSGYNEVFINKKFELDPNMVFLRKPFTTQQLTDKISAALA
ncbi:MAG: response regulator [Acidobacteria bacterium]|nr:response regulator [Acidobacteriota bacterium]